LPVTPQNRNLTSEAFKHRNFYTVVVGYFPVNTSIDIPPSNQDMKINKHNQQSK
jgi:hypothetical protein